MATILDVRDALMSIDIDVYHFYAPDPRPDRYMIWGETAIPSGLSADDKTVIQKPSGEIYYYTTEEYDEVICEICEALEEADVSYQITNIGYDSTLRQVVYSLEWSIACGTGEIYRQR